MSHEFVDAAPHPSLRAHVRGYTGYVESGPPVARLEEPPGADPVLVISLGPTLDVADASGRRQSFRSFAAGLGDSPSTTEHGGHQAGVQVRLDPFAARALLGMPVGALANRIVELEDVLGSRGRELEERLAGAPDWRSRFGLLDAAFVRRLAEAAPAPPDVEWAWRRLVTSGGRARIDELASELGWSRRHFSARFQAELGLPPKTVARLVRFERAARRLRSGRARSLGQLALDCGYYDQAHLNRDFRSFAGVAPGEFAARRLPDGGGIAAPAEELPFVQDGAAAVA
jgi:AraC-like DNA-binding protein